MKPATGVVLLLVVVVLLYAVALALGIAVNRRGGTPSVGGGGDWLSGLGNLTSPFATPLDVSRLQCGVVLPNGALGKSQPVARPFELNEDDDLCRISIPRASDDYRHAVLEALETTATKQLGIYVQADCDEEDFEVCPRGRKTCFRDDATIPHPFRLEVTFEPDEEWNCWLQRNRDDAISVTAPKEGVVLELKCIGCSADAGREINLQMK